MCTFKRLITLVHTGIIPIPFFTFIHYCTKCTGTIVVVGLGPNRPPPIITLFLYIFIYLM